jgi:outer membrane biosynthesis protein TonB
MSRCLALAVDNKELPRNAKGKVTVELVIAPGGKASDVRIARATIASRSLDDCLIGRVKEIQFPDVPRAFPTSYTYGFEAT